MHCIGLIEVLAGFTFTVGMSVPVAPSATASSIETVTGGVAVFFMTVNS